MAGWHGRWARRWMSSSCARSACRSSPSWAWARVGENGVRVFNPKLMQADDSFPVKPQRIVADTRAALGRADIVLADTGAVKMWMARLYPAYEPNTCLTSNGLSAMAFALPGAIGAKLAEPGRRVLAAAGDGAFLMKLPGKGDRAARAHPLGRADLARRRLRADQMEDGPGTRPRRRHRPRQSRLPAFAESFGARGYRVNSADDLLPVLTEALAADTVSVIACPVDYSENLRLTDTLGELSGPF